MAWVEKDHNDHLISTPAMCRVANHETRLPRATSSLASNAPGLGRPRINKSINSWKRGMKKELHSEATLIPGVRTRTNCKEMLKNCTTLKHWMRNCSVKKHNRAHAKIQVRTCCCPLLFGSKMLGLYYLVL